ncbi:hypothetical protein OB923_04190 [Bifidobacterium catenulatum subsp. kashiwanohense]|uniref:hypothetical protein n=1 Tax=Bifidobacterium catenulatum TaxID=1686 RepID=UPI002480BBA1|nr:hypothetical protein [Bifidobacterium catenulatum]MDH7905459.1 hypothetical protein [Bifidobacterium catenulatum subsp. kashiwanohense]
MVHSKGKIIQVIEDSGQATQYRISVTPTDYGGWDEQVDDLPHVGLGVGPFWPFRPPARVMTPYKLVCFSLHGVLADANSKPHVARAATWFTLHGSLRCPVRTGPSSISSMRV